MGRPSECSGQKPRVKMSCSMYSGLSRSILISSRTTCCSFFTSSGIQFRPQHEIGQYVEGDRQMFVEHFRIEADLLFGGKRVQHPTDGIHFPCDVFRGAPFGSLENHVLEKVRHAVFRGIFAPRSVVHPDTD